MREPWRESVGKAVSQYLSHLNLVVQEEERLVLRKFVVLTAYNEKIGSVVSRVMSGLAQVRVPKRKVKANSKPANLLQNGSKLTPLRQCTARYLVSKSKALKKGMTLCKFQYETAVRLIIVANTTTR